MPALYDQYQLANSSQIPQYVGSVIPELTKVAQTMQERYDVGQQQADLIDQAIRNASASRFDQPILDNLKNEYRAKLKSYADRGDYENIWRNVALDARDFVSKYKPIAANQAAIAAYQEELNKAVENNKLTPEMVMARMALINDTYQGLWYNDKTGQYENKFVGPANAHLVDLPKKVNEWLQHTHPWAKEGTVRNDVNGYYVETSSGRKDLPWKSMKDKNGNIIQLGVEDVIKSGMKTDPEVQAYLKQEEEFAPYYKGYSNTLSDDAIRKSVAGNPYTQEAFDKLMEKGYTPKEAYKTIVGAMRRNEIEEGVMLHGMKGVQHESSYSHKVMGETEQKTRDEVAKANAPSRFLIPTEDMRLTDQEKDPAALYTKTSNLQSTISTLTEKLKTAPPEDKKLLNQQLIEAKNQLENNKSIITGTLNETAKFMGYKNIDDLLERTIPKNFGYIDPKGREGSGAISRDEVIQAIKNGGLQYTPYLVPGVRDSRFGIGSVTIPGKGTVGTKQLGLSDQAAGSFLGNYKQITKTNADNYAFKPLGMNLTDNESKELRSIVISHPSSFQWFKPGNTKPSSAPDDFDLNTVKVLNKDGKIYLQANEMETKKNVGRRPTGDVYTVQIDPGSNVGKTLARNIIGNGKNNVSPDMMRTAAILSGYTFDGDLNSLQMHGKMTVRDENGDEFASVVLEPYESDPTQHRYVIYENGKKAQDKKGNFFQSDNPDDISQWLQESIANSIAPKKSK